MGTAKKNIVKFELLNPRYSRSELKDHASEFIHYARYAGYVLKDFNVHLSRAKLHPLKPEIAERNHRLCIETTTENAKIILQIIRIYPSFSNWKLKMHSPDVDLESAPGKQKKPPKAKKSEKSAKAKKTAKTVKKAAKKAVKKSVKKKKSVVKKKKTVKKTSKKATKVKKTKSAKKTKKTKKR